MSDEEKKAMVELSHFSNMTAYWKQEEYTNSEIDNYIKIILNLIEKQQKEIEVLKRENKEIREWKYVIDNPIDLKKLSELDIIKIFGKSYIAKDKIKAKIEELKVYKTVLSEPERQVLRFNIEKFEYGIELLQSLLEEKE